MERQGCIDTVGRAFHSAGKMGPVRPTEAVKPKLINHNAHRLELIVRRIKNPFDYQISGMSYELISVSISIRGRCNAPYLNKTDAESGFAWQRSH